MSEVTSSRVATIKTSPAPLLTNEQTVFEIRHSSTVVWWQIIVISAITTLFILALPWVGFPGQLGHWIAWVFAFIGTFIDLLIILEWRTSIYTVTNLRVQSVFGIIGQSSKSIAVGQITDVQTEISILGKIFNFGNVLVEAANLNSVIIFHDVANPAIRAKQIETIQAK